MAEPSPEAPSRVNKVTGSLALLARLRRGWNPTSTLPQEFAEAWRTLFDSPVDSISAGENTFEFSTELDAIKLRGMNDILCIASGGPMAAPMDRALQVWRQPRVLGRSVFLLAFSEASTAIFDDVPKDRCLRLGPTELTALFASPDPKAFLKSLLRSQFSLRRLVPFDIGHAPQSHVFYGRHKQLADLIENERMSYALVGPLGIGKTTLLRQYKNLLLKRKDPRAHQLIYVNFAYCTDPADDLVARFIAMAIDPSSRSYNVKLSSLAQLIRKTGNALNGPPELLCDEVDDVCNGKTFQILGNLMRDGHCRLLLSGRGSLYRLLTQETDRSNLEPTLSSGPVRRDSGSAMERRQLLMRLEALSLDDARKLIAAPLADLGLSIDSTVLDKILHFTGRIPHLMQYCAVQLINEVANSGASSITMQHFDAVRWSFDAGQFFTDPLRNFDTAEAKYLALVCLSTFDPDRTLSISELQELASAEGLDRNVDKTKQLCDELVINNVLMWSEGRYKLATGALSYYARDWGYLDRLRAETKLHLGLTQ
jgi:hypothetical protein